mmetsp:Transcript_6201/g.13545  ORF Transcript_6201/g.13545 Transcript_6201/m.13545 type:complete len:147 (-) Transcript_6201:288-728(-)
MESPSAFTATILLALLHSTGSAAETFTALTISAAFTAFTAFTAFIAAVVCITCAAALFTSVAAPTSRARHLPVSAVACGQFGALGRTAHFPRSVCATHVTSSRRAPIGVHLLQIPFHTLPYRAEELGQAVREHDGTCTERSGCQPR